MKKRRLNIGIDCEFRQPHFKVGTPLNSKGGHVLVICILEMSRATDGIGYYDELKAVRKRPKSGPQGK